MGNTAYDGDMSEQAKTVKISKGGRIVIPAAFRKQMGLETGDDVVLELEEGTLRVQSRAQRVQRALDSLYELVKDGPSMADELIAERRTEAARRESRA